MLNPDVRHLLTDALRPPTGWRLDAAVATTFTLDLTSLLLAPLSMAAYNQADDGIDNAAPHELLEAIRRYAERTIVFCQAGGIHVPTTYRKLVVFAEASVVEVQPPPGQTFHPKIWVLRFTNEAGHFTHRLLCLSRNLTGDRSWDTALVADESTTDEHLMPAAPASRFLDDVVAMSIRPLTAERAELVHDIADTLRDVHLVVPAPFTSGRLVPLGTSNGGEWPMPPSADRAVVISPFLDVTTVRRLPANAMVVSRAETFDRLGAPAFEGHDLRVLQPYADAPVEVADAVPFDSGPAHATLEVKSGLHAKVLAWDIGSTGHLFAGSANATSAAFAGNIEFNVLLSGPAARCGAAAILKDDDKQTGFIRLLQPHTPAAEGQADDIYELEREIEAFHVHLATCDPRLEVVGDGDAYVADLAWTTTPDVFPGDTWVRPITLKPELERRLDGGGPQWTGLGLSDLTIFLAVRTRLARDGVVVERSSALRVSLNGAPDDRDKRILRELLTKIEDVLRYLALLLKDPSLDDVVSNLLETTNDEPSGDSTSGWNWVEDLVLVEPMVRAFARDDGSLNRVERLLDDLRDDEGRLPDLGPEFNDLWQVVSNAQGAR